MSVELTAVWVTVNTPPSAGPEVSAPVASVAAILTVALSLSVISNETSALFVSIEILPASTCEGSVRLFNVIVTLSVASTIESGRTSTRTSTNVLPSAISAVPSTVA